MGKNTPIDDFTKRRIIEIKQTEGLSARKIAARLGLHHKTVSRILKEAGVEVKGVFVSNDQAEEINEQVLRDEPETSEVKGDTWTISMPKTRIHTLDELLAYCEVDLTIWEVERFVCNKWEMGYKDAADNGQVMPLFQVKAFLRKKKDVEAIRNEINELKELAKSFVQEPPFVVRECSNSRLMLELNMPDTHFGKLAWGVETGYGNYDVKITEAIYWEAFETILARVSHFDFDHILFVVGNDLLNSDDIEGRTTSGTYVSSDARYHKTFAAVRTVMVKAIEKLRQIARVKVVIVSGNHDQLSCWHLGDSLECYFHNHQDVEIDNLPRQRKYHQFGQTMLMFTHGHKGKRTDYPLLMATEQPKMFGDTKFRECHTGHLHYTKLDEQHGVRVRVLPSLCAPDDWLSTNGFVGNLRNAEGYVWSADEGLISQAYYTVPEN